MLNDYREIDGAGSCEVFGCWLTIDATLIASVPDMHKVDYLDRVRFFFFLFPLLLARKRKQWRHRRHNRKLT
jgi:hypothetical protein